MTGSFMKPDKEFDKIRQETNMKIIQALYEITEANPSLRFDQILLSAGLAASIECSSGTIFVIDPGREPWQALSTIEMSDIYKRIYSGKAEETKE